MPVLDLRSRRQFFASRAPLPAMVYAGGAPEANDVAQQCGVEPDALIAAFNRSLRGGIAHRGAPVFLAGGVLTPSELRYTSRNSSVQTVALSQIAEFRAGFDVAEIVLRGGERVRWPSELIPFLRFSIEGIREVGSATERICA